MFDINFIVGFIAIVATGVQIVWFASKFVPKDNKKKNKENTMHTITPNDVFAIGMAFILFGGLLWTAYSIMSMINNKPLKIKRITLFEKYIFLITAVLSFTLLPYLYSISTTNTHALYSIIIFGVFATVIAVLSEKLMLGKDDILKT